MIRSWLDDFRKCAPRRCASPSSWRARAGRLSQVCDTSIRSREVTATSATNDWTWPSRRATSYAPCGGTPRDRAEPLKPPTDIRYTRTIPIYGRAPIFPIALNFLEEATEVRIHIMCPSRSRYVSSQSLPLKDQIFVFLLAPRMDRCNFSLLTHERLENSSKIKNN